MGLSESLTSIVGPAMRLHQSYAAELTHDLSEDQMDFCPGAGHENTPRFTLGHLCCGAALFALALEDPGRDGPPETLGLPDGFEEQFRRMGPGDRRLPERCDSPPTRQDLLAQLRAQHDRITAALRETSDEVLESTCEWKLSHHLPRLADLVEFFLLHESMHLGQLASWRRAQDLPPAMARMAEMRI